MPAVTLPGSRAVGVSRRTSAVVLLLLVSLALTIPDVLYPQNSPTARMLRRVAEAVDGHRSGRDVWVVVSQLDTVSAIGVFEIRDSALAAMRRNARLRPQLMGPYATIKDANFQDLAFLIGCHHDGLSAMHPRRGMPGIEPPDGIPGIDPPGATPGIDSLRVSASTPNRGRYCPSRPIPLADIAHVTLSVRLRNGTMVTDTLPLTADAVFFSLSAIDKFVVPYYARVLGADQAAAIRRSIASDIKAYP